MNGRDPRFARHGQLDVRIAPSQFIDTVQISHRHGGAGGFGENILGQPWRRHGGGRGQFVLGPIAAQFAARDDRVALLRSAELEVQGTRFTVELEVQVCRFTVEFLLLDSVGVGEFGEVLWVLGRSSKAQGEPFPFHGAVDQERHDPETGHGGNGYAGNGANLEMVAGRLTTTRFRGGVVVSAVFGGNGNDV